MACSGIAIAVLALCAGYSYGHRAAHNTLESFNVQGVVHKQLETTKLEVNTTAFKNGDWVEVRWSGVRSPALDDLLALYVADADVQMTSPIKYIWAIQSISHISSGNGSHRFRLVNMRKPVRFAFLRSGLNVPVLEAFSKAIEPVNLNEPSQVHLALTGKAGEMLAQWTTLNRTYSGVRWGDKPGRYHRSALSDFQTYTRNDMCGAPANSVGWSEPGLLHNAVMDSLRPSTRYYYVVGDVAEIDGTLEHTEMLASLNTTRRLAAETDYHQLLIHNGDISYARGYSTIWDAYWDQMMPLTSRMPYMAVPGNHERDWPGTGDRFENKGPVYDSGGECGVAFERRVKMPLSGPDKFWYSFDFGPIHFLQYSTEHSFEPGSEQHEFMMKDLQGVDRSRTPWLIVGGHRPFVVDSDFEQLPDGDLPVARDLQKAFGQVFEEAAVSLTLHGHHHSYQRSCALSGQLHCLQANADGSQNAPIHLVIGHAGAGLSFNVQHTKPSIFEVVKVEHGYMRAEANGTSLSFEVISSIDGSLMDSLELKVPADWGIKYMAQRDARRRTSMTSSWWHWR